MAENTREKRDIVMMPVHEIKPYPGNPRINDGAVKYVANSILEFGFRAPIILDKNNVIIAGHTRWKAAMDLDLDTVPCIIADDLTEEQARAYRLADNKTGELAGWDFALLDAELGAIGDLGGLFDMADFGFKDLEDVDIDSLFEDKDGGTPAEKSPKKVQCPRCGEWFEL